MEELERTLITRPAQAQLRAAADRITRDIGLTRWHVELGDEAVAQFIRALFAANLPSPLPADPAQQAVNHKRWRDFVVALAAQMESKQRLGEVIRPPGRVVLPIRRGGPRDVGACHRSMSMARHRAAHARLGRR